MMIQKHLAWESLTQNGDNIVIATHYAPDGDALGSAFGLAFALEAIGKKPVVVLDNFSQKYAFMQGCRFVHDGDPDGLPCDMLVVMDCGSKIRMAHADALFNRAKLTVSIDHHLGNTNFAAHNYVDETASSTCEVVFDIINQYVPINAAIAESLFTGICTDTGGFCYNSTSPKTLEIVIKLMRVGIDFEGIQRRVLYRQTRAEAAILATALKYAQFVEGCPIVYSALVPADLEAVGADYTDLDFTTNYLINVEGAAVSALFTLRPSGKVKVSMRSLNTDVSEVAKQFGGGGHKFAAAALFDGDWEEGKAQVLEALKAAVGKTC